MAIPGLNRVVLLLLGLSALVGGIMLATDAFLWAVAPTHAYGVIAFMGGFVVLMGLILWRPAPGLLLTMIFSGLIAAAMLLDPLTANLQGPSGELIFGGLTVEEAFVYLWARQAYFTFPILFALVILTLVFAWLAWRRLRATS